MGAKYEPRLPDWLAQFNKVNRSGLVKGRLRRISELMTAALCRRLPHTLPHPGR